jgi:hypothetical protein
MGIETLNSAAHAAGFAMAAPEEAYEDLEALPSRVDSPARVAEAQWQQSRGVLVHEKVHATAGPRTDWLGLLLSLVGRRPATRRPALTAEA